MSCDKNVAWEIMVNGSYGYLAPLLPGQDIHIQEITPEMCKSIRKYTP